MDYDLEEFRKACKRADAERRSREGMADKSGSKEKNEIKDKARKSQADILIALAKKNGASLFRTPDGDGYADIVVNGHRETWPLRSSGFRKWLRRIYFFELEAAPNKDALEAAVETLDAEAQFSCDTMHPVELRVAYHDGKIYYDLCNDRWEVVEITATNWKIVIDAPVRFRRTSTSRPQVTPVKGGKLGDLRSFLNLKNNKSWILLVSAMLKYFYEPGGHPIIELCGEHGTAKTTTERIISLLVDPSAAPARCPPVDQRDLTAAAYGSYVLAYDNLSSLPVWLSDALCRLATGAGLSGRTLYTNTDETIVEAKRPLILTGINALALRGDIADRANKIVLEKIEQGARKDEASFWHEFETAFPKLVGAIMDALVIGLKSSQNQARKSSPYGGLCNLGHRMRVDLHQARQPDERARGCAHGIHRGRDRGLGRGAGTARAPHHKGQQRRVDDDRQCPLRRAEGDGDRDGGREVGSLAGGWPAAHARADECGPRPAGGWDRDQARQAT